MIRYKNRNMKNRNKNLYKDTNSYCIVDKNEIWIVCNNCCSNQNMEMPLAIETFQKRKQTNNDDSDTINSPSKTHRIMQEI